MSEGLKRRAETQAASGEAETRDRGIEGQVVLAKDLEVREYFLEELESCKS